MIPSPNYTVDAEGLFSAPQRDIFLDEGAARRHLEGLRWPDGAYCPHCLGRSAVHALGGKCADEGIHFCSACRRKFTVRVGTIYERSHIPLNKWLLAVHLLANAKSRFTAHLLSKTIGVQYRSASFMTRRIRTAMTA
jgi:transposase-like protein